MNEALIYFKQSHCYSTHIFQWVFYWLKLLWNSLIWCEAMLSYLFYCFPYPQIFCSLYKFPVEKKRMKLHKPNSVEYKRSCTCTTLCFTELCLSGLAGAALAQPCISQSLVCRDSQVLHLHNPVFPRAWSVRIRRCCTCTTLCFPELGLSGLAGAALAQPCISQSLVCRDSQVLHLHNPVFPRAWSVRIRRCCTCTTLCFPELGLSGFAGAALAQPCVSQS